MSVKEIVDIGCSVCVQTCMCDVLRIQHGKAEIIHPDDVRRASYVTSTVHGAQFS